MQIPHILHDLLSIRRPSGGRGCAKAQVIIIKELKKLGKNYAIDEVGNIICNNKFNGVLYSSHYDTVHWNEGTNEIRCDDFGIVTAWKHEWVASNKGPTYKRIERDVLGADDAAGIYIMLQMLEADIKGTYVFHADEEIGCVGSTHIAKTDFGVDGIDIQEFTLAVAFDRKGASDLIVNQLSENMASIEAASHIIDALNIGTILNYKPAKGIVTDTAMYAEYVEECFNMSVGYYDEHTEDERLDLTHLLELTAVLTSNPDLFVTCPIARKLPDDMTDDEWQREQEDKEQKDYTIVRPETIAHLCHLYPDAIATLLETFGYDYPELFSVLNEQELI